MARQYVQTHKHFLKASIGASDTSITLTFLKKMGSTGDLSMTDFGDLGYATIDPTSTTKAENISFTGVTDNGDGTFTLTGVTRGLKGVSDYSTGGNAVSHSSGATVVFSNSAPFYAQFGNVKNTNTWDKKQTFSVVPETTADATSANDMVRLSQLQAAVLGTLSSAPLVMPGNAGETVAADKLVFLNDADSEWYLADADVAAEVNNVMLGITRGAGTDGNEITNGITVLGKHTASSAIFTANQIYYASNTAGEFSSTPGTNEVTLGVAISTTVINFIPRFNQQLTEDQQDALVGNNGSPSTSNKYVTQSGLQIGAERFGGASAVGSDSYAVTLSPALSAYTNGQILGFEADVANTGACTIDFGPGAKTIKKNGNATDLADGDIAAGDIVFVVYDSGSDVMQMISKVPAPATYFEGAGNAEAKTYHNFTIPFLDPADLTTPLWAETDYGGIYRSSAVTATTGTGAGGILSAQFYQNDKDGLLTFGDGKNIRVEWQLQYVVSGGVGPQSGFGLAAAVGVFADFDQQTNDACCFTVDTSGNLYAHCANAGSGHTETQITGITLGNINTYRIEFDAGSEARFYVNGTLEATVSTNLPDSEIVQFGHGCSSNANYQPNYATAPRVSVEL